MLGGGGRLIVLEEIRCPVCKKKLMTLTGRAEVMCPRCKSLIVADTETRIIMVKPKERQ